MRDEIEERLIEWLKENVPEIYRYQSSVTSLLLTFNTLRKIAPHLEDIRETKSKEDKSCDDC